jgi:hypothetical protein
LVENVKFLLCGIDSLDLGLDVVWAPGWKRRIRALESKKQLARRTGGLVLGLPSGRSCILKPSGKGENYRFHLQFEAYNVYIAKAASPGLYPNVYLSISAKTLWQNEIEKVIAWISDDLRSIGGGKIQLIKVSRLDLCADFLIPGGLSQEFLLSHKVTHNEKSKLFLDNNELETYYVGDASSPIQLVTSFPLQ